MYEKIMLAFNPIITLVQGISYPISFIAIATGILLVTCGQKKEGFRLMKLGAIGYLMMQWLPGIMKILHDVGKGMR